MRRDLRRHGILIIEGETKLNLPEKVYILEATKSVHDPPWHIGPTSPDNLENLPNFLAVANSWGSWWQ
jgi:hypothetical protein